MIFLKLATLFVVCRLIAIGFCEEESKKRDKLKEEVKHEKFLVMEAYDLMQKEKRKLVSTIRELREENSKLRWQVTKVKK